MNASKSQSDIKNRPVPENIAFEQVSLKISVWKKIMDFCATL